MILTCPECNAHYNVKEATFGTSGRRVRCAKCGHSWFQDPPDGAASEIEEAVAAPPTPEPEHVSEPPLEEPVANVEAESAPPEPPPVIRPIIPQPQPVEQPRRGVIAGWVLLVVFVLSLTSLVIALRQKIATAWPQSASFYAAIGMPVNLSGIAFADVRYNRQSEDRQTVLAVSGTLVNVTAHSAIVPPVRVILSGADGRELYRWQFQPPTRTLGPGQTAPFKTRLSNPPDAARHLTLELATDKSGG